MKTMKQGFTLIELMIVVAIIGILAAIAIPKFADLINKSKEGATKGALSSVRSALQVYYGDNEGWFPTDDLSSLVAAGKYISNIPVAKLPGTGHVDATLVTVSLTTTTLQTSDASGWAYFNDRTNTATWDTFVVNCNHYDLKGAAPWTSF